MRFTLTKTTERNNKTEIEINTLEDLIKVMNEFDEDIVIHKDCPRHGQYMIEVYDDYRE